MKKNQRLIASVVLAGALIGAGAPMASAAGTAPAKAPAQVQVVDTHRAVTSAADVNLNSAATAGAATAGTVGAAAVEGQAQTPGGIAWLIGKLKGLGASAWNKLVDAARAGYTKFKEVYERVVPWLVRKAIEVGYTIHEIYSIVRDFIG
ncbi:hypothetical protein [Streptomyces erythrochromogenes]|uniref:hypothetical protein n=1 Tax=Streptomyces erythrochromogenes TaxID=285574 RepID=UPI003681D32C